MPKGTQITNKGQLQAPCSNIL